MILRRYNGTRFTSNDQRRHPSPNPEISGFRVEEVKVVNVDPRDLSVFVVLSSLCIADDHELISLFEFFIFA